MSPEDFLKLWREAASAEWKPVTGAAIIGIALFIGYIIWQQFFTFNRWVFPLDNANLAIHEAGHPIVGLLVRNLAVYGGTIFQLLFPLIFAGHFWWQRHGLGWAVTMVWFGENLLNIGRYMADARAHELPLVGGGEHDWTEIFNRWGVLQWDTRIGGITRLIGFCMMLSVLFWIWKRWRGAHIPQRSLIRR